MNDPEPVLSALSDPTRRRVIELLSRGPQRAGELATGVGMAPTAMSRHLRHLRTCGLIDVAMSDDDGRARVYRLRGDGLAPVERWLSDLRSQWADQLARFKQHVEGKSP